MASVNTKYINNKYLLLDKIGSGAFGSIYKGKNIRTNKEVAIKIESIKNETNLLKNESNIYQYLINTPGIPAVKWFGKDADNYYMVIDLLGNSLQLIKDKKRTFNLKLVLQIGIQIINLLKTIHDKGLVHRDIKPENFLFGISSTQLYLIDFGFCKSYMNNDVHNEIKHTNSLIGSLNYVSINGHNLIELSRRDDLESLGYMLVYFYCGKLQWSDKTDLNEIKILKQNVILDHTVPEILREFLKYLRYIAYNESPNYLIWINKFTEKLNT